MTQRMPPPKRFRPVGEIARMELPDEQHYDHRDYVDPRVQRPFPRRPTREQAEAAARVERPIERDTERDAGPTLHITATITIPVTDHYAKRLAALITQLREEIEEQAPWLDDVRIDVRP